MKTLMIANTIITTKYQAVSLIKKLNCYFSEAPSYEMALALDTYTERLVDAGFLTWDEVEQIA